MPGIVPKFSTLATKTRMLDAKIATKTMLYILTLCIVHSNKASKPVN